MRLADAELLPFDFDDFTDTIRRYIDEVQKLARDKRDQIVERNRQIDEGVFAAVNDPRASAQALRRRRAMPPFLNFAPLENGLAALQRTAKAYDKALAHATENGGAALARAALRDVNARLIAVERALTLNDGLPNRAWFKHQIYAPGFYTGYGVKTLPAVRESIEQKEWKLADEQIVQVGKVLENAGEAIQGATTELERADIKHSHSTPTTNIRRRAPANERHRFAAACRLGRAPSSCGSPPPPHPPPLLLPPPPPLPPSSSPPIHLSFPPSIPPPPSPPPPSPSPPLPTQLPSSSSPPPPHPPLLLLSPPPPYLTLSHSTHPIFPTPPPPPLPLTSPLPGAAPFKC